MGWMVWGGVDGVGWGVGVNEGRKKSLKLLC